MEVRQLRPGLWRWTARHPDWRPEDLEDGAGWGEVVASYSVESDDGLVLIDPLAPVRGSEHDERFWSALDRDVARLGPPHVLLTIYWHARSSQEILDRFAGARVWAYEPAAQLVGERVRYTDTFGAGDRLPGGIEAIDAKRIREALFWLPAHRALIAGDVLLGSGDRLHVCPDSWLGDRDPNEFRASLRPLLELPIELLLLTHGEPVEEHAREALRSALDSR